MNPIQEVRYFCIYIGKAYKSDEYVCSIYKQFTYLVWHNQTQKTLFLLSTRLSRFYIATDLKKIKSFFIIEKYKKELK